MIGTTKPEDFVIPNDGWILRQKPHRLSTGKVVSTNGAWIVVFDDWPGEYDPMPAEKEQHMIAKYMALMEGPGEKWTPMAGLVLPVPENCKNCNGKGHLLFEDCDDCDGEGSFEFGSHIYECKECDGSGAVVSDTGTKKESCVYCFGVGEAKQPVSIGGSEFSAPLVRKLAQLPDAKIRVEPSSRSGLNHSLGVIHFYGGKAILAAIGG